MTTSDTQSATKDLLASFQAARSRRSFLKGTVVAGLAAAAGGALLPGAARAQSVDSIKSILSIAATAEELAVTFYRNGIRNGLGLAADEVNELKAAQIEEQIHHDFFVANGGTPLTSTFSFPAGASTFTDLPTFIATQQQLEGAFDAAFIAAVEEFAILNQPVLARLACQIAMIESEHRVLGRDILNHRNNVMDTPADNWAFGAALLKRVGDAPGVLQSAGYLSPTASNSYDYIPTTYTDPAYAPVYAKIINKNPLVPETS